MAKWWSDSKGAYMLLEQMHGKQLANGLKKLERGDYCPPDPLSDDMEAKLAKAMRDELANRGLDLNGNEIVPPPGDSDAPMGA